MRNFDQRMEEIRRRSEEIFRQRRRRNRILLTCCVPLVLGVAISSALLLGLQSDPQPPDAAPDIQDVNMAVSPSTTISIAQIQVVGPAQSVTHTDPEVLLQITEQLPHFSTMDGTIRGEELKDVEDDTETNADSYPATTGYVITLLYREGEETEYFLSGNILREQTTGIVSTLTEAQAEALYALLGVARP